jgi:Tfp pilus assembly protein PilF
MTAKYADATTAYRKALRQTRLRGCKNQFGEFVDSARNYRQAITELQDSIQRRPDNPVSQNNPVSPLQTWKAVDPPSATENYRRQLKRTRKPLTES